MTASAAASEPPETTRLAPEVPPGWSYNPAPWSERIPTVGLAMVGS